MLSKEEQMNVFNALQRIAERKGSRKKMASIFEIADELKLMEIEAPKILIEACLDLLIQHKLVRYFKSTKGYYYFGVTEFGWQRWDAKCNNGDKVSV